MIISTIAIETAIGNIDHILEERQRGPLLVYSRVHRGDIRRAAYAYLSGGYIHAYQDVRGSLDLGDGEDQVGGRIIDGCAGNAQGGQCSRRAVLIVEQGCQRWYATAPGLYGY